MSETAKIKLKLGFQYTPLFVTGGYFFWGRAIAEGCRKLSAMRSHCSRLRLNPLGLRKRYKERYSFLSSCCGDSRLVQVFELNRGSESLSWLSPLGLVQFRVLNPGSEPLPKSLRFPSVGWFSGSKGRFNGSSRDGATAR